MIAKAKKSSQEISERLKKISEVVKRVIKEEKLEKKIKSVFVFGSAAHGKETKNSDIDFMVEFLEPIGLIKFCGIKLKLEDVMGKSVDLLTPNSVHPALREEIFSSLKIVYEKR